ncbi:hypothetical protein FQZ97_949640 [compost metagenome]
MQARTRLHKPAGGLPATGDLCHRQRSIPPGFDLSSRGQNGALEAGEIGLHRRVPTRQSQQRLVKLLVVQRQRWQPIIGRGEGRTHILQGLPLVDPGIHRPGAADPPHISIVPQKTRGQGSDRTGKVAPVVVIAHAVQVRTQADRASATNVVCQALAVLQ